MGPLLGRGISLCFISSPLSTLQQTLTTPPLQRTELKFRVLGNLSPSPRACGAGWVLNLTLLTPTPLTYRFSLQKNVRRKGQNNNFAS